ncbi:MAG: hypothetical protein Q9218_002397 [Villophora microphyllina]
MASSSKASMGPPQIPTRTSSKRAQTPELETLKLQRRKVDDDIRHAKQRIKAKPSMDATYWSTHKNVSELQLEKHEIVHKISLTEFKFKDLWLSVKRKKAEQKAPRQTPPDRTENNKLVSTRRRIFSSRE